MSRISKYPLVIAPADDDVLPVVQAGITKKLALSLLKTYAVTASDERIQALEDTYVKLIWFEQINSGTTGTIEPPSQGTIVLNQWAAGIDALASKMVDGMPSYESPKTAGGVTITASLDLAGNWSLSGIPSAYPVALIYVYKVPLESLDVDFSLGSLVGIGAAAAVDETDPVFGASEAALFEAGDKALLDSLSGGNFGNLDGGFSDSTYGGISPIDCGGSV